MHDLNRAIKREDVAEVQRLLSSGHEVNAADEQGGTPLMVAAGRGNTKIIGLLLDAGADPNVSSVGDWVPLAAAAAKGYHSAVLLLLKRGADPRRPFSGTTVAAFIRDRLPEQADVQAALESEGL